MMENDVPWVSLKKQGPAPQKNEWASLVEAIAKLPVSEWHCFEFDDVNLARKAWVALRNRASRTGLPFEFEAVARTEDGASLLYVRRLDSND